jgi:hypothetical protein
MKRISHYRPSGATGVAILALFIALGGTSYGVATGSIDSREIKNNTVRSKDVRNNTIRSKDVRNHTLRRRDFRPGVLVPGPRGATGATGAAGRNGTNGFGTLAYPADFDVLATGNNEELDAVCPDGTFPTGGAASAFDDTTGDDVGDQVVQSTFLLFDGSGNPAGYGADFNNATGADVDVLVEGVCANAGHVVASRQHRHSVHR